LLPSALPQNEMRAQYQAAASYPHRYPQQPSTHRIRPAIFSRSICLLPQERKLDETALAALDQAARRACKPIDDKRGTIEYRTKVAGVIARRTATIAYERAGERR